MKLFTDAARAILSVCICCLLIQAVSNAQSSRDRRKSETSTSEKSLEVRLEKAEQMLVDEYKEVAVEFLQAGEQGEGHVDAAEIEAVESST